MLADWWSAAFLQIQVALLFRRVPPVCEANRRVPLKLVIFTQAADSKAINLSSAHRDRQTR
jgi:hypothetical protein